jgi:cell division septum initiation protein DivIVA
MSPAAVAAAVDQLKRGYQEFHLRLFDMQEVKQQVNELKARIEERRLQVNELKQKTKDLKTAMENSEFKDSVASFGSVMHPLCTLLGMKDSIREVACACHPQFALWLDADAKLVQRLQATVADMLTAATQQYKLDPVPFFDHFLKRQPAWQEIFHSGADLYETYATLNSQRYPFAHPYATREEIDAQVERFKQRLQQDKLHEHVNKMRRAYNCAPEIREDERY